MNDFTKEELHALLEAFHYARDSACWTKDHEEPELIDKIHSMIDNYCEHGIYATSSGGGGWGASVEAGGADEVSGYIEINEM